LYSALSTLSALSTAVRAGINISTQIKNGVCNTVWDDLEKNRCFKHPPAARESMRPIGPDSSLEKRLTELQLLWCGAVVYLFFTAPR
jgi:hypothetical protein